MTDIVIKQVRRTGKLYPPPAAETLSPEDMAKPFPGLAQEELIRDALASVDRAYIVLSTCLERILKLKKQTSMGHGRSDESRD